MFTLWYALWAALVATACLACTGDLTECVPFKTVECGSSVYDISFVLDRSLSMQWTMTSSRTGRTCPTDINRNDCRRQDIMRFVLRQVLLKAFQQYQQKCLEYQQSALFVETKIPCRNRGYTFPRFHTIWWWGDGRQTLKAQNFSGPAGITDTTGVPNVKEWNPVFIDYFYRKQGGNYLPREDRWTGLGTDEVKMKEEFVKKFFEEELLKGNIYPTGDGSTFLYRGFEALDELLTELYGGYTPVQKNSANFPIFVMTDGELTRSERRNRRTNLKAQISDIGDVVGGSSKLQFYGMGLTSKIDDDLQNKQTSLYEDLNFQYKNSKSEKYFFDDKVTANRIVGDILQEIAKNCEDCYVWPTVPPTKICVPVNATAPKLPGTIDNNKTQEEPPVITADSEKTIEFDTVKSTVYVQYGNPEVVRVISSGTTVCWERYVGTTLEYIPYDTNGDCTCCGGVDKCLCEFRYVSFTEGRATIRGVEGVGTNIYEESDTFIFNFKKLPMDTFPLIEREANPNDGDDEDEGEGEEEISKDNDGDDEGIGGISVVKDNENPVTDVPDVPDEKEGEVTVITQTNELNSSAFAIIPSTIGILTLAAGCLI